MSVFIATNRKKINRSNNTSLTAPYTTTTTHDETHTYNSSLIINSVGRIFTEIYVFFMYYR